MITATLRPTQVRDQDHFPSINVAGTSTYTMNKVTAPFLRFFHSLSHGAFGFAATGSFENRKFDWWNISTANQTLPFK